MKTSHLLLISIAASFPATCLAQSAFVGTWKADIKNDIQLPKKPNEYLLKAGVYHCKTCAPPWSIKADGEDHPVSGHPYFDTVAIKVIDDHTIQEVDKKGGKPVTTMTVSVSADGKTSNVDISDSSASNAEPVKMKGEATRVGPEPAGAHAVSGAWRTTRLDAVSDNGLLSTWSLSGDTLKFSTPTGQSYAAPLDGTDSPFVGDPGQSSISLKKVDERTIDEIDRRQGKVIGTSRMTASADGKTIHVEWKDLLHGTSGSLNLIKQ